MYNEKKWHLRFLTIHGLSEKQNVTDKVIHVNDFNTTCLWVKKGKKEVLTYKKSYICLIRIKEEKEI